MLPHTGLHLHIETVDGRIPRSEAQVRERRAETVTQGLFGLLSHVNAAPVK